MKIFLVVYISMFLIQLVKSVSYFYKLQLMNKKSGIDLLSIHPTIKSHLIMKPIFWPWFFITEKSPIERISELFFKNYGDKDRTYLGNRGLKNFSNDVLRGKNRYVNYKTKKLIWSIDENSQEYKDCINSFGKINKPIFASIIYAQFKEIYLLHVTWSSEDRLSEKNTVSRFELDDCKKISDHDLKKRLFNINPEKAREFLINK